MSKKSKALYTVLLVILKVIDPSYYFGICNAALKLNVAKIKIKKDRNLSDT